MAAKGWWIAAVFVSLLAGWSLRGQNILGSPSHGISVTQQQFAVRAEEGNGIVMVSVPLLNKSGSRDRLVGVKSSCSCVTTAELPQDVLPGESFNLPLRIDSSRYSPGDKYVFEVTLFLESGSAVPVKIDFEMAEGQSSSSGVSNEKAL